MSDQDMGGGVTEQRIGWLKQQRRAASMSHDHDDTRSQRIVAIDRELAELEKTGGGGVE